MEDKANVIPELTSEEVKPTLAVNIIEDEPMISFEEGHHLPTSGLPPKFLDICKHIAEVRRVPQEVTIMSALTIAGAAVGANVSSKFDNYTNLPGLWTMIIAPSASGKSQPMKDLMKPLDAIDRRLVEEYTRNLQEWRTLNAKATTPTAKPKKTQIKCDVSSDAGRVEFLCDNPRGGIFYRDELKSFFDGFKGQFAYDARSKFCEINDFASVKMTTKTEEDIKQCKQSFMPILGGIQPGVLPRTIREEDLYQGLLQRFVVIAFEGDPIIRISSELKSDILAEWNDIAYKLWEFGKTPHLYSLTSEAYCAYVHGIEKVNDLLKRNPEESEGYYDYKKAVLNKLLKFVHRAALIVHCLKIVEFNRFDDVEIDADIIRWAFACLPYLLNQQMNAYNMICGKKPNANADTKPRTDKDIIKDFAALYLRKKGEPVNRSALANFIGIKRENISAYLRDEKTAETSD